VTALSELLPDQRDKVTPAMMKMLQLSTGYRPSDIFRKCVRGCVALPCARLTPAPGPGERASAAVAL